MTLHLRSQQTPVALLAVAGLSTALHLSGVLGKDGGDALIGLAGILSAVAIPVGIRRNKPALRWPWWSLQASLILFVIGGAARAMTQVVGEIDAQRNLLADLLTVPGYMLLALGIWGIGRARRRGRDGELDTAIDGLLAALALLVGAWVYVIDPALSADLPLAQRLVLGVYPMLSIVTVGVACRIAFSPSARRSWSFRFCLLACSSLLIGDIMFMFAEAGSVMIGHAVLTAPYLLAFVATASAVLHPSMRELASPVSAAETAPRRGRLAVISGLVALPMTFVLTRPDSSGADRAIATVMVTLFTVAVCFRVYRALRTHADAEDRFAYQATHDALTGLPNGTLLHDHLERALKYSRSAADTVALIHLDLDRFKLVNDTYGHGLGDELLIAMADRLRGLLRPDDLVARPGGDEFVIVLENVDVDVATEVAERIRSSIHAPFEIRAVELHAAASLGVAFGDAEHGRSDAESLLANADTAMYWAKDSGRDAIAIFDREMHERVSRRLAIEAELHRAVEAGQLRLEYQPVVDLPSHRIRSVEALIRWDHPTLGLVPPDQFIPVAEETGMIGEIGAWVLREATGRLREWRAKGLLESVAVNLSAKQLKDPNLLDTVRIALHDNGLPPEALTLELTESVLVEDPAVGAERLAAIRSLGVGLSIDDFGTGYSSLAYLKEFPIDCVKIDKSFVRDLGEDETDRRLAGAIVAMARALGVKTVAEGVETAEQERHLQEMGCTSGQGWLYARSTRPEELEACLAELAHRYHRTVVPSGALPQHMSDV